MLLKDFYNVNTIQEEGNLLLVNLTINKDHEIFKGHFPDNPVTPGVCMMQIIKELTEQKVAQKLFMKSSGNVKFLEIINPEINAVLDLSLDINETENGYKVKNVTKFDDKVALKLTSTFEIKN